MTERIRIVKLLGRIQLLISKLNIQNDQVIQQHINQSYYRKKMNKWKILLHSFEETQSEQEVITQFTREEYTAVFYQWRKDVRRVNKYLRHRALAKPIL